MRAGYSSQHVDVDQPPEEGQDCEELGQEENPLWPRETRRLRRWACRRLILTNTQFEPTEMQRLRENLPRVQIVLRQYPAFGDRVTGFTLNPRATSLDASPGRCVQNSTTPCVSKCEIASLTKFVDGAVRRK
jgi:hypothetical protein